jgi:hypothetical protein
MTLETGCNNTMGENIHNKEFQNYKNTIHLTLHGPAPVLSPVSETVIEFITLKYCVSHINYADSRYATS